MYKNYVGLSRDHSMSMQPITRAAARDYNSLITDLKNASQTSDIDTIISVVKCGVGRPGKVVREIVNSSLKSIDLIPEDSYQASGSSTPLFDSIGELIELFEQTPDAKNPEVAFMIMVVTDGQDNDSHRWSGSRISTKIKELQATDRWTFVFRVPKGAAGLFTRFGIPAGNIHEWDTNERGMMASTVATSSAVSGYYSGMKSGVRSTTRFYTDMSNVSESEVKAQLVDISNQVVFLNVITDDVIEPFCVRHNNGRPMIKGAGFYQLTKVEPKVQDYKKIAIRDKLTNHVYAGAAARQMLNLPSHGTVRVAPGDHSHYDIFIQSTSVNRKLPAGSILMYWPNATIDK